MILRRPRDPGEPPKQVKITRSPADAYTGEQQPTVYDENNELQDQGEVGDMLRASHDLKAWQTIGDAPKAAFGSFSVDRREVTAIVPPPREQKVAAAEVKSLDGRQQSPADTIEVDRQARRKPVAALAPIPQCVASRRITEKIK